jgi:hypothetical protein
MSDMALEAGDKLITGLSLGAAIPTVFIFETSVARK